jgi:Ca2+-binding EF-hand superfamily protein
MSNQTKSRKTNQRVSRKSIAVASNVADEIAALFVKLDKNGDGKIDFDELKEYISELNRYKASDHHNHNQAEEIFELMSSEKKKQVTELNFRDFVEYVNQTDKKIELFFKDLDKDGNGFIDKTEIKAGFEKMGIFLSNKQVDELMLHLDKDGSLHIDWNEWRDFFRFTPHTKMEQALRYWRVNTFTDFGDHCLPQDYTLEEKKSGIWLINLFASALACVFTRTITAPLDRVRIYMQVIRNLYSIDKPKKLKNILKFQFKERHNKTSSSSLKNQVFLVFRYHNIYVTGSVFFPML